MRALELEWNRVKKLPHNMRLESVYFGGGTPSLLNIFYLKEIVSWIKKEPFFDPRAEISIEANPEKLNLDKLHEFLKIGINRISIGVQSFNEKELKILSRQHDATLAMKSVEMSHKAGFESISIDLMYEIPDQSLKSWIKTVDTAMKLPITHLSLYNLVFEKQSVFYKKRESLKKKVPAEEIGRKMYDYAIDACEKNKLEQYEISAFAKPGFASKHNSGYWTARPFLGLGPAAFSYWEKRRYRNIANLIRYQKALNQGKSCIDFQEKLSNDDRKKELLAIALRLKKGLDLKSFEKKFGELSQETYKCLDRLKKIGWLEGEMNLKLSEEGFRFYDSVATELI